MKNNNQKNNIQEEAITKAIDVLVDSGADITTLFQQDGIMTHFKRNLVERVLQGELTHHLGYGRYEHAAKENNSRNKTTLVMEAVKNVYLQKMARLI
jgi:transposase-like protein